MSKTIKICLAASSGGHLEQVLKLKPLSDKYKMFLVTEKTNFDPKTYGLRTYFMNQVNRREWTMPFAMVVNAVRACRILILEKPDVIISTGVLATIPLCLIAKMTGRKLIFIESFAKTTSGTLTGRLLYKFADRFIVQWPQMKSVYPKAEYWGGIY